MLMGFNGAGATMVSGSVRPGRGLDKTAVGVWPLLQWAFAQECAQIDFADQEVSGPGNVGIEWIMIQQARLGCRPDGGGHSEPHPDADIVAAHVATLPPAVGGQRMALTIAELARSGQVPDAMVSVRCTCAPADWTRTKHGPTGQREFWRGSGRWPSSVLGRDHGYAVPVRYTGTAREVAAARRAWLLWWDALLHLRAALAIDVQLSAFEITDDMPPMKPWEKKS